MGIEQATHCLTRNTLPSHKQLTPQLQAPHHVEGHRSSAFASISLPCISFLRSSLWVAVSAVVLLPRLDSPRKLQLSACLGSASCFPAHPSPSHRRGSLKPKLERPLASCWTAEWVVPAARHEPESHATLIAPLVRRRSPWLPHPWAPRCCCPHQSPMPPPSEKKRRWGACVLPAACIYLLIRDASTRWLSRPNSRAALVWATIAIFGKSCIVWMKMSLARHPLTPLLELPPPLPPPSNAPSTGSECLGAINFWRSSWFCCSWLKTRPILGQGVHSLCCPLWQWDGSRNPAATEQLPQQCEPWWPDDPIPRWCRRGQPRSPPNQQGPPQPLLKPPQSQWQSKEHPQPGKPRWRSQGWPIARSRIPPSPPTISADINRGGCIETTDLSNPLADHPNRRQWLLTTTKVSRAPAQQPMQQEVITSSLWLPKDRRKGREQVPGFSKHLRHQKGPTHELDPKRACSHSHFCSKGLNGYVKFFEFYMFWMVLMFGKPFNFEE